MCPKVWPENVENPCVQKLGLTFWVQKYGQIHVYVSKNRARISGPEIWPELFIFFYGSRNRARTIRPKNRARTSKKVIIGPKIGPEKWAQK